MFLLVVLVSLLVVPRYLPPFSDEASGVSINDNIVFKLDIDEGEGQYLYDNSEPEFHSSNDRMILGATAEADTHDPMWSANTLYGYCLYFDGIDDYVISEEVYEVEATDFTVDLWIQPGDIEDDRYYVIFGSFDEAGNYRGIGLHGHYLYTRWGADEDMQNEYNFYISSHNTTRLTYCYSYTDNKESICLNGMFIDEKDWGEIHCVSLYGNIVIGGVPDIDDHRSFAGYFSYASLILFLLYNGALSPEIFWNFQEGHGNIIYDRSRSCVNEDMIKGAGCVWTDGVFDGRALMFNSIPPHTSPTHAYVHRVYYPPEKWTISMWIWPTSSHSMTFFSHHGNSLRGNPSDNNLELGLDSNLRITFKLVLNINGSPFTKTDKSTGTLTTSGWQHLDFVFDVNTLKIYINYQLDSTFSMGGPLYNYYDPLLYPFEIISLGWKELNGTIAGIPNFDGRIDDLWIRPYAMDVEKRTVGYYKFDSDANDDWILSNNNLANQGVSFVDDPAKYFDKSASFDGASYLYLTNPPTALRPTDAITLQVWVYPTNETDSGDVILWMKYDDTKPSYALTINDEDSSIIDFHLTVSGTQQTLSSRTSIPKERWSHVSATYDGSYMRIYINGKLDNYKSISGQIQYSDSILSVGAKHSGGGYTSYFEGYLDELKISDYARNLHEDDDGDGMLEQYELMRSVYSKQYNPNEFNGRYAILIGNNDNTSDSGGRVAAVMDVLNTTWYLKSVGWFDCDISLLYYKTQYTPQFLYGLDPRDNDPTHDNVLNAIYELQNKSTTVDTVFIMYVGHGIMNDQTRSQTNLAPDMDNDEYFPDWDRDQNSWDVRYDEGFALRDALNGDYNIITDDTYANETLKITCRQFIHFIESCNSGGFFRDLRLGYETTNPKPWNNYVIITPCHENDDAFIIPPISSTNGWKSFFVDSIVNMALRGVLIEDQYDNNYRLSYGRVDWNPDEDCTYNNLAYMETDADVQNDPHTKADAPSNWQRNHYTETGYQPNDEDNGQDFLDPTPPTRWKYGERDYCVKYVSVVDYDVSDKNGIVDLEEAFYFAAHNEFLGFATSNPELMINRGIVTHEGDDPLIYDSSPNPENKVYF